MITLHGLDNFVTKVNVTDSCWLWTGGTTRGGYGQFGGGPATAGKNWRAHRLSYRLFKGEIPEGIDIDHICRTRLCVNPDHLQPCTRAFGARQGAETKRAAQFCRRGHSMEDAYVYDKQRQCRTCTLQRTRRAA